MKNEMRIIRYDDEEFPARLRNLHDPPAMLYACGGDLRGVLLQPVVAIVGSRKLTAYGKSVTNSMAAELARTGVTIASGLAIGVDGVAHRAAVEASGLCVAVLPCGLNEIYPASHRGLAEAIIKLGGTLVSEYPPRSTAFKSNFVARNRIVSALSDAVLIPEAAAKSGTMHTARFALEQGKEVLAVPGNITSETSVGTNNLIKAGAGVATCSNDVLHVLGLEPTRRATPKGATPEEQLVLNFLASGVSDGSELLSASGLTAAAFNQTLTMLEISGLVRALGGNRWGSR